jgi:multidrug efflux system outer membrane protein
VILTLVAAVADSYVRLRELDKRLEIARNTLGTREESLRIARRRFEAGLTSELPFRQAQSDYEQVAVTIPGLERQIVQQENLLNVLLGRNPGPIPRGRRIDELALPGIPEGLPSQLLERRPDIVQAEQELIAANARIGVAKAQYFPSISLTGLLGGASAELSKLFSGSGRTWSYGGTLLGPIFTAGGIAGQVQSAEALQQQALAVYERAIQTAFAEVEDGLIGVRKSQEEFKGQTRQVEALGQYARLARLRYDNGYISYLEVVDAERNLFDAELTLAQSQGGVFQALINLYKAMGGGWVAEADKMTGEDISKISATKGYLVPP